MGAGGAYANVGDLALLDELVERGAPHRQESQRLRHGQKVALGKATCPSVVVGKGRAVGSAFRLAGPC